MVRDIIPPKKIRRIKVRLKKKSAGFGISVSIKKVMAVLLIMAINWGSLSTVIPTSGYMSDVETSGLATVILGTLDFVSATSTEETVLTEIKPGEKSIHHVVLQNTGSLPFEYGVDVKKVSGDENVCEFLQLEAFMSGQLQYSGGLINFATSSIEYATSSAEWEFDVSFPADALPNIGKGQNCSFDFSFTGWQFDSGNPKAGFFDEEDIAGDIKVLNDHPAVIVDYPNGGEEWFIVPDQCAQYYWCRDWCATHGMNSQCQYEIKWSAENNAGPDDNLGIDIWYSTNSGHGWQQGVAQSAPNTGSYLWKIPYDYSLVSDKARIKIAATDKNNFSNTNWDESDEDFCPPLFTMGELMNQEFGLTPASGGAARDIAASENVSTANTEGAENISIVPVTLEEIKQEVNSTSTQAAVDGLMLSGTDSTNTGAAVDGSTPDGNAHNDRALIDDSSGTQTSAPAIPENSLPADQTGGVAPVSQIPATAPEIMVPEVDFAPAQN